MNVYFTCFIHGQTDRHQRARSNWNEVFEKTGMIPCFLYEKDLPKDGNNPSKNKAAFLKDVIKQGYKRCTNPDDVVIWTNDDVSLKFELGNWARQYVPGYGAISMRRDEPDHMGRELFAFTKTWLDANFEAIPNFIIGAPYFDLVIAAMIRKGHGHLSTLRNMKEDIHPSDSQLRLITHEPHQSSWSGKDEHVRPGNVHNRRLASLYCNRHMPTMKL